MIIAFSFTSAPLLAGAKSMTRRSWSPSHAARFHAGNLVDAYDRSPRVGGHKIATIRITQKPYRQWTADMALGDYGREGFAWLADHGEFEMVERIWEDWRENPRYLYVVEFSLVEAVS